MSIRVRFAPSPTGFLHVGGLRTALYNYLFARRLGGVAVLRIEDTDRSRFVEGASENIIATLRWAGIEFDESPTNGGAFGPYTQSERLDLYRKHAEILREKGEAYFAFDTAAELETMRQRQKEAKQAIRYDRLHMRNELSLGAEASRELLASDIPRVLRLKVPDSGELRFQDSVRGEIVVQCSEIDDQVLLKSDGFPTYHLANVVDDHLMQISHVIRGEEWLPSTSKHVLLYRAFGWEMPVVAHLPLLLNPDKSKLSKRQGDVAVEDYRAKGYLPAALVNFVALLGWNPTADREIYSLQELIDSFDICKVNKGGAVFDLQKLNWMNTEYVKQLDPADAASLLLPAAREAGYEVSSEYLAQVFVLLRERITFLHDLLSVGDYMFHAPQEFEEKFRSKHWKDGSAALLRPWLARVRESSPFDAAGLHELTAAYVEEQGVGFGKLMNPVRLMITGKGAGAGMFDTMALLGRDESLRRMDHFLDGLAQ